MDKKYDCPHPGCAKTFQRAEDRDQHFKAKHNASQMAPSQSTISRDLASAPKLKGVFACRCKKTFTLFSSLVSHHQALHEGDRPPQPLPQDDAVYTCSCNDYFTKWKSFNKHYQHTHVNEPAVFTGTSTVLNPWRCDSVACSRSFRTAEALAQHSVSG